MARKSSNYDPNSYGVGFEIMPEGVHDFRIQDAMEEFSRKGTPQWKLMLQPIEAKYSLPEDRPYLCWLPEDGVVEAIFDSAGYNPQDVDPNKDYKPEMFRGRNVSAEVFHKEMDDGKVFANIRRLHPVFSRKKHAAPEAKSAAVDDGLMPGDDEMPF